MHADSRKPRVRRKAHAAKARPTLKEELEGLQLITAKQLARILQVSQRTLYDLIGRGQAPQASVRLNQRVVRWKLRDIRDFLDGRRPT